MMVVMSHPQSPHVLSRLDAAMNNLSPIMRYTSALVVYGILSASVGRCLTTPASSKVDAASQDKQDSGLALIYGYEWMCLHVSMPAS